MSETFTSRDVWPTQKRCVPSEHNAYIGYAAIFGRPAGSAFVLVAQSEDELREAVLRHHLSLDTALVKRVAIFNADHAVSPEDS